MMVEKKKKRSSIDPELALNILRGVPDKAFLFFTDVGEYTGISALGLSDFVDKLDKVPLRSVEFHFNRGDFRKWAKETLCDEHLAATMSRIGKNMKGEELRKTIQLTVRRRLTQLRIATRK
jgi:hypothetical protein